MVDVWIPITIVEDNNVADLRDYVFDCVDSDVYEKEEFLHVSLFPGIDCSEECVSELKNVVEELSLESRDVSVSGFHFYPSEGDPMVVALDVDVDLSQERDMVREVLNKYEGECIYTPVTPHLTLFKGGNSGDSWSGLNNQEYNRLFDALSNVDIPQSVTFEKVEVKHSSAW